MWKLLRNVALLALLLTGGLKLLLEYAVRQDAGRTAAQLAPIAQLRYEGISAGINGSVELTGVSLTPAGRPRETYGAERVTLQTPGPFWILRRWLLTDTALPPTLEIDVVGPKIPATAAVAALDGWISPSLVPFETQGCGVVSHFSVADYQRMGLNPGKPTEHFEFRYDAETSALDARAVLVAPGLSNIALHTEVQPFDSKSPMTSDTLGKLHAAQFSIEYTDQDYLQRRNRFCAQLAGINPTQFPDQHVAAVLAFLQKHQIDPGVDLVKMYRTMVAGSGRLNVLSLPKPGFKLAQVSTLAPEDLLRNLNMTARYNNTPPVMFRLAFETPPTDSTDTASTTIVVTPPPIAQTTADIKKTPQTVAATPIVSAPTAKSSDAVPTISPMIVTPPKTVASMDRATAANSGRLDKHSIREPMFPIFTGAPAPSSAAKTTPPPTVPPDNTDSSEIMPSIPEPPPGSTMALVWKPQIQRLPPAAAPKHDYDVIDYAALSSQIGKSVRLITSGGKQIEGMVQSVDNTSVELRVRNVAGTGGNAQMQILRTSIREVQVPHRATAT
jgi:hypothetical protein